jgi:hypothetical protein
MPPGAAADAAAGQQLAQAQQQAAAEAQCDNYQYVKHQSCRDFRKSVAAQITAVSNKLSELVHKWTYCAQRIMPNKVGSHALAFVAWLQPDGRVSTATTVGWNNHPQLKAAVDALADAMQAAYDESVAQQTPIVPCLRKVQQAARFSTLEPVDRAVTGHGAGIIAVRCISNMYQNANVIGEYFSTS